MLHFTSPTVSVLSGPDNRRLPASAVLGRDENKTFRVCDICKIPKTTEKIFSVWVEIGATGAKFNSFPAQTPLSDHQSHEAQNAEASIARRAGAFKIQPFPSLNG